ncbi:hypothetical protein [Pedobacter glucosidilyticus]|uniref:hypothetical protein n=1 Tax=Pedobacter glucosidilyticus TaxID=1122941 RepID=UPI0026EF7622|nr:hypothetical protein [Pedobacter glucosidilyticus]
MKVIENDLVMGSSGKIGKMLVFRQVAGKTIVAKRGIRTAPFTENQEAIKERFKEATLYAKAVTNDPISKQWYEALVKPGQSAYNLALADFCKSPTIKKITLTAYNGQIGNEILIRAVDNFSVETVQIELVDTNGNNIETGVALLQENGLDWMYTVTANNPTLLGTTIRVTATDLPGNQTVKEEVIQV